MASLPRLSSARSRTKGLNGLTASAETNTGSLRTQNEDAYLCDIARGVLLVADGMGGLARGDVASRQVVSSVTDALSLGRSLVDGLRDAHVALLRLATETYKRNPMGSTAVALTWRTETSVPGTVSISWIGDSRAYRWRDGCLEQLTHDHSLVQDLLDLGAISAADAEHHPNRNVITRALGVHDDKPLQVDSVDVKVCPGDRFLLCSDGLTTYLPEARITEVMAEGVGDEETAKRLVQLTLSDTRAGDNITVICASVRTGFRVTTT